MSDKKSKGKFQFWKEAKNRNTLKLQNLRIATRDKQHNMIINEAEAYYSGLKRHIIAEGPLSI